MQVKKNLMVIFVAFITLGLLAMLTSTPAYGRWFNFSFGNTESENIPLDPDQSVDIPYDFDVFATGYVTVNVNVLARLSGLAHQPGILVISLIVDGVEDTNSQIFMIAAFGTDYGIAQTGYTQGYYRMERGPHNVTLRLLNNAHTSILIERYSLVGAFHRVGFDLSERAINQ